MYTHVHARTCLHTCIHEHAHARAHIRTCVRIRTCTYMYTHAHARWSREGCLEAPLLCPLTPQEDVCRHNWPSQGSVPLVSPPCTGEGAPAGLTGSRHTGPVCSGCRGVGSAALGAKGTAGNFLGKTGPETAGAGGQRQQRDALNCSLAPGAGHRGVVRKGTRWTRAPEALGGEEELLRPRPANSEPRFFLVRDTSSGPNTFIQQIPVGLQPLPGSSGGRAQGPSASHWASVKELCS